MIQNAPTPADVSTHYTHPGLLPMVEPVAPLSVAPFSVAVRTVRELKTATRETFERFAVLTDPETGEDVTSWYGVEFHRYYPRRKSAWVRFLDWIPSDVAGSGTLKVHRVDGRVETHYEVPTGRFAHILRGTYKSRSGDRQGLRSTGASIRRFFANPFNARRRNVGRQTTPKRDPWRAPIRFNDGTQLPQR